jgi:hypothetical protein
VVSCRIDWLLDALASTLQDNISALPQEPQVCLFWICWRSCLEVSVMGGHWDRCSCQPAPCMRLSTAGNKNNIPRHSALSHHLFVYASCAGPVCGKTSLGPSVQHRFVCVHVPLVQDLFVSVALELLQQAAKALERTLLDGGPCRW